MEKTSDQAENDTYSACANPRCNCAVKPGEKYCCESCAQEKEHEVCQCGHVQCQAE